jgi:hypothetical protein
MKIVLSKGKKEKIFKKNRNILNYLGGPDYNINIKISGN